MSTDAADQSGHEEYVTPKDLRLELKAFRLEVRLLIVLGLLVTRFHLPDTVTVGSVLGVLGIVGLKSILAR